MRIAFLTPEFPSEVPDAGGLASYLGRAVQALRERGHEPEVFTSSARSGVLDWRGVRVEQVARIGLPAALAAGLARLSLARAPAFARAAASLAWAAERRHRQRPFDAVQSASYAAAGLWLRPRRGRPHVVRLSSIAPLLAAEREAGPGREDALEGWLERRVLARADALYAPSAWLAARATAWSGRRVEVIRPPFFLDCEPEKRADAGLPRRYLLHAGKPGRLKGSDRLAAALPLAWREEPELALVICGNAPPALALRWRRLWGARAAQVHWLRPQPRPALLGLLEGAAALVAVSRCENLPNLALESLALETPLVAHRGASYEELVDDGSNGRLVDADEGPDLAQALVEAWRGHGPFAGGRLPRGPVWRELEPGWAVDRLVAFLAAAG